MTSDKLISCTKCGCDACYATEINETKKSYFCWGCGYQTSDLMKQGEFDTNAFEENIPELYKDVKYIDSEKRIWYPTTINIITKGTVFLFGTNSQDISWAAIKTIPLTDTEKSDPKYKGTDYKSDSKSLKYFGNDFIEACDHIGFFDVK